MQFVWLKAKDVVGYGYLVWYDGRTFSMDENFNNKKFNEFDGFNDKQVVQLRYDREMGVMTVVNVTTKEQISLQIEGGNGKELYFGVCMNGSESSGYYPQIEYMV